jgi:hypothetical protein
MTRLSMILAPWPPRTTRGVYAPIRRRRHRPAKFGMTND